MVAKQDDSSGGLGYKFPIRPGPKIVYLAAADSPYAVTLPTLTTRCTTTTAKEVGTVALHTTDLQHGGMLSCTFYGLAVFTSFLA